MELAVEKIIHSQRSIGSSDKEFDDVTDKVKQLKCLFPNWEKEELLNTLYDSKGNIDIAIKNIMEGDAKKLVKDNTKNNKEDKYKENVNKEKDKSEKDNKLIVDDKEKDDNNHHDNKNDIDTSEIVLEKSVNEEVEMNKDSKSLSVKSSKSDKKSYKSYSNSGSGRSKSKYLSYDTYYKHYYSGNYRSFGKRSDYKKKSYYEREKESSKTHKSKKSVDESVKEEKIIDNVNVVTQDSKLGKEHIESNNTKKLSWAQIAKPKNDNNRECKVIIEKKSTTEHVIRKEIKSSKENSNETISIKITIKESGNGDNLIQDDNNNQENVKEITNKKNIIENNCDIKLEDTNMVKKEEIEMEEYFDKNEKEDLSSVKDSTSPPISDEKIKEKEDNAVQEEEEEIKIVMESETENEQEKTLTEENINGKSENSTEILYDDTSEKKKTEEESMTEKEEEEEKENDINENIIIIDNKSRIDKLNEKIAKRMSHSKEEIYTASKMSIVQDKKGEEISKNTFIQSTLKNKISLSDISKVELHFGTLQCSGKNIENKTFFIDDGNTLYQNMNEENNSNDTINVNDVNDLNNLEFKDKQFSSAELLASSENATEGSSPSSTEENKAPSETTSTTSSKTEGSVPPYRHPYAGQSYNPVFHQNNYKNYNRRNNYRDNNGHFREGSNSFNNNRNMGYYHKSNKYNNDYNYDGKNHHHGHNYSNNKYGYRNNYNNKYYYSNNKNNHVSFYTPYKFYNPIMAGKPISAAPAAISASPILISNATDMSGITAYHVSSSVMNLYNNQNTPTTAYPVNMNNSKDSNHFAAATALPNSSNICYSSANPPYMKVLYVASSQYANPIPFNPKYQNVKSYNPNKHYYLKNKFNNNHNNYNNNSSNNSNTTENNENSINDITQNNNINSNVDISNTTASITTTTTTTTITTNNGDSSDINDTQQSSSYKNYSSDETVTNDVPTASSNLDVSSYNSENK